MAPPPAPALLEETTPSDVEEDFLAAYDLATSWVEERVRVDLAGWSGSWGDGVRLAVTATADLLATDPGLGRLCTEVFFAGARGIARHRATVERLVPALAAGRHEGGEGAPPLPAELERGLLSGAILALGRASRPAELVPGLTYHLLVPYLGPAAARRLATGA